MGISEANKEIERLLEEMSSDSDSDENSDAGGEVVVHFEEEVEVEVFREKTIEDIIEEQRAKLAAEGKAGTPVTAETFAKWRAGKLLQRQAEAEARMKLEQTKRKGGKGLCKKALTHTVYTYISRSEQRFCCCCCCCCCCC